LTKFIIPKWMVFVNYEYHFIKSIDDRQLFTCCGKVAFANEGNIAKRKSVKVKASEICTKCLGGIKAID